MADPQSWDRVLQSPAYQALPREAQLAAKNRYFHEVVAPKLGSDPQALNGAYAQFMEYKPIQLGQGETIRRVGGAGLREGAAGVLTTLGGLLEYAGEHPSGEMGLPAEAYRPVYGTGDPLFKAADRQTDQARKVLPQPGEKAPFWGQLIGGTTGILAAPFAAQQAATDQLRRCAGTGQAIAAAAVETPASAIQLAVPGLGGRLGGRLINQPGLRRLGVKALGGGVAEAVAEPLATEVRNQGLPETQRQPLQVTPEGIGQGAVFGLLARGAKPAAVPAPERLPGLAGIEVHEGEPEHIELRGLEPEEGEREPPPGTGIEVHEGEPEHIELRGLDPEPGDTPAMGSGLQEASAQARPPDRPTDSAASHEVPSAPPSEGRGILGGIEVEPPQHPTVYSVAYEIGLDAVDFGKSRDAHNRILNDALAERLEKSSDFMNMMKPMMPELDSWIAEGDNRDAPEGWTWEHASTSTAFGQKGVMRLVPSSQHTPGSPWWRLLHPDRGASGGYAEWAVPNGAPSRKKKR